LQLDPIRIAHRFRGPPESGNGGYVAGRLARYLPDAGVAVRLHRPPPLDTELAVRETEDGVELAAGEALVASARPAKVAIAPLEAVGFEEAEAAARRFPGLETHYFPSCFVCGPDRAAGDGLRIFPGPLDRSALFACPWVPDASLATPSGRIGPEFLWSALDCPGGFSFPAPENGGVLLGELRAELTGDVSAGERCVLVSRELDHDGRKHTTAAALFGEDGGCRGVSLGIWIEVET
jgi:hypothetical protein